MIPAKFFASVGRFPELPDNPRPHIAFVGRSNVGKSSLVNHLANQKKLARISREPGRTQTMNLYDFSGRFFLIDLPGYGYAKTSKTQRENFSEMITEYLSTAKQLRMTFVVIDARIPFSALDEAMMEWLRQNQISFSIIMNKMDKVAPNDAQKLHKLLGEKYPNVKRIEHSIHSGKNQKAIWGAIETALDVRIQ
ncbi:MAG: ribosome biogenesis GTP-binding protein YihA/YsxC [Patescibacteria group bacterium]|jgi:GTP-binding protein